MKVIHAQAGKPTYIWPPQPGRVYSIPVDEALKIGDGFTWRRDDIDEEVQMQVIGLDMAKDGKRVFAVVD